MQEMLSMRQIPASFDRTVCVFVHAIFIEPPP